MRKTILLIGFLFPFLVQSQEAGIPLPKNLPQTHPRLLTVPSQKSILQKQIKDEPWAKEVLQGIKNRIDPYVEKTQSQPDWLYSRLMMYWKSKAVQVYIRGGVYSHADGEAPVPTVRFGSTRGLASVYSRPKIEDIIPYMDDTKGVYFHNTKKAGNPLEWGEQANASGIESINEQIMGIGKDAAFMHWLTNDTRYAKFAYDLFDTYMMGMYYRTEPIDLNNSHAQTLVGLSTFEVIQERILNELSYLYDFLHEYIKANHPDRIDKYEAVFKKWIDITIKNGVPQNNWNLHQAKFILKVAMVLEDNKYYTDGKGREYYIDYILNKTSARQWSLTKFLNYGYDAENGVWAECPGYAQGVTRDLTNFIRDYDNTFNQNLLPYTPVMQKAVQMLPQYLFPNGVITAFGDTHYVPIYTESFSDMIRLSQKYKDKGSEELFTKMYRIFEPGLDKQNEQKKLPPQIYSFFTAKPLVLDRKIPEGDVKDYITPAFYAPNVSWFVQRNQYTDKKNGLMISQAGSLGNHMHSNGVSIELYGKGYVLGVDPGKGSSYFQPPYLEYYSQFPAHNTVMVDGISKYPEMLSNHAFDLLSSYPESGKTKGYYPEITYSNVYFLEPESRSDQNRFLSIIQNGEGSGYYVDIFRSKKQRQGDKFHDYYYHNLGQEFFLKYTDGKPIELTPNEEPAFAGGHLFALDYMWDKKSAKTNKDYEAVWKMSMPSGNHVYMNMWMKGYEGREIFSIKSPPVESIRDKKEIPYDVNTSPSLTLMARQYGEAWNRPFVAIYEPSEENTGKSIASIKSFDIKGAAKDFVGIDVLNKSGRRDLIFSSAKEENLQYENIKVNAVYAVVSKNGNNFRLFLGNGRLLSAYGFTIQAEQPVNVVLEYKDGVYYFVSEAPVTVTTTTGKTLKSDRSHYKKVTF